jgi:hypothetical protein
MDYVKIFPNTFNVSNPKAATPVSNKNFVYRLRWVLETQDVLNHGAMVQVLA